MAVCNDCEQEMTTHAGCTVAEAIIDGVAYPRRPYGSEPGHDDVLVGPDGRLYPSPPTCHDCAVPVGGQHHPGCDWERCPRCGGQAISCGCRWDGNDADDVVAGGAASQWHTEGT